MSTRSSILIAEDGINNLHVYTEGFESNDIIYMESWYRDEDEKTISEIITMPRPVWDALKKELEVTK